MSVKIALAGNPNSGKTTLFNALTGSNQYVGNWPGVTVEKKEGKLRGNKDAIIMDLPGIYSLSPYTLEEVVARDYLLKEKPDAILNIVDGSNIERNLYLTTQLLELGIPVVLAVNMIDIVEKNRDKINVKKLSAELGCEVIPISALKGTGISEVAEIAVRLANKGAGQKIAHRFSDTVENALDGIAAKLPATVLEKQKRFVAIKMFERDDKIDVSVSVVQDVEAIIASCEDVLDDDSESIITNERYEYITSIIDDCLLKTSKGKMTSSDKIDSIVTNRWLALPIFALVMIIVYSISVTTVGTWVTDWTNDGLFGDGWHLTGGSAYAEQVEIWEEQMELFEAGEIDEEPEEPGPEDYGIWVSGIPVVVGNALESAGAAEWLSALIVDGIVAGVGAVLGFVPQMLVLFIFLAFLEGCGYMARVAFIMDRIFRKFGLSGKSFIPFLIGTGCGVPGIMASRTIESERDRRMTIMTTTFVPCGAKLPIIALIAGALFGGAWWVSPSAYFIGIGSIVISGIMLKKTKMFSGDVAPFVMELPAYHLPGFMYVMRSMWERGWSFIKKAGTIILLSSILIWFLSSFGIVDGQFGMVEDLSDGMLAAVGRSIAWIFAPLGFGNWEAAVATLTGLVAKEVVVATLGILYGFAEVAEDGAEIWTHLAASFTALAAYSFLVFNLLCAPCFAAIGAIRREMNNGKWTWFAVGYQTVFAYILSLIVYQIGNLLVNGVFGIGTVVAFIALAGSIYMLIRKPKDDTPKASVRAVEVAASAGRR